MSGHTKGPWVSTNYGYEKYSVTGVNGALICSAWQAGNANLIAAAPELLEALSLCLIQLEKEHMPSDEVMHAMHHARAAICKALPTPRGEE